MMNNDTAIATLKEKIDDLNQQAWDARVSDSPRAFQLSEESVKLARSINYPKGLAEGLRSLGFGYVRLFKNDEAAPLLRESLSLFQSLNDLKGQAVVYEYLGIIERNWGNLGASLELLLKGNELALQTGPLEVEVTSCYQVGVTYKHLGNHDLALDYLYKSLSLSKEINLALMEAYAINIIGSIYFDNGNYAQALDCFQQGLVIRQESHDKWGEAGSLDNIGFTYLKLNELDKAIDYCKQSLHITQSTNDKKGEANTLLHLAEIYQQAGDIGQASKFSNQSLEIRKLRGDKRGEAEVLLFIADLYKNSVDIEDQQIFEWISIALNIADEIKAQDLLSKAYLNLHEYYTRKGNYKESLVQLEAHLRIEKELHKNAINQKVQNLEISHKAEEIKKEAEAEKLRNKELTELNEQIEKANEELRIEASLERVRTTAMAMKEPADMLRVCRMISDQLLQLGFKEIRNVQTVIIYPQKHEYLNYQYFTPYDKDSIETIDYRLHPDVLEFTNQMLSSPDAYYNKTFEGEELRVWREYRKQTSQLHDPKLDETTSSHYYFYSIGSGALGVTTYARLSNGQIDLFKRFRNVFELAYRRFIDIEKAHAQVREAQIEAALEKVRSRSLAMHQSSELEEVIMVVSEQLQQLQFRFHNVSFVRYNEKKGLNFWLASPGRQQPFLIEVPYLDNPVFNRPLEAFKNGVDFIADVLTPEENHEWLKHLIQHSVLKNFSDEDKKNLLNTASYARSLVLMKHIILVIGNFAAVPYTEEQNLVLKRFANVFDQAYTRFLDLQKAEAQAREAQIEAALERVRAKSMAMHHSEDLITVINIVQEQLLGLGFHFHGANFVTDYSEKGYTMWLASPAESFPFKIYVPQIGQKYFEAVKAAIEKGSDFATYTLNFEEKNIYFKNLFENSLAKNTSEEGKRKVYESKGMAASVVLLDKIRLNLMNLDLVPFTDEENNILKRFGYLFEQSYTRFLDLQKAEAQAREAQIELALERVRAKAMAMQEPAEFVDVINVIGEQFIHLDFDIEWVNFGANGLDIADGIDAWNFAVIPGGEPISSRLFIPRFDHPLFIDAAKQLDIYRKTGNDLFVIAYDKKDKDRWLDHLFAETIFKDVPVEYRAVQYAKPGYTTSNLALKDTFLSIGKFDARSFTDEQHAILKRFGNAFGQAYTRFLDLQKAEAQAREAQIEAGLERVRSKTMAMHKSEEVTGVAVSLNEELLKLGFKGGSTIIIINKETGDTEQWTGFSENKFLKSCYVPYFKHPCHDALLNAWKKGEKFLVYTVAGDEKRSLDEHYFSTGYKDFPESDKSWMRQMESVTFSHAFMKYGAIHWGPGHLTEEQLRILQRFSIVFEQSYTRFLDLQKAEAQTKEAQREVALERIRARAMAMHSSNELMEVAHILREQMGLLDQPDLETSVVNLFDEDSEYIRSWHAFKEPGSSGRTIDGTVSFRKDSSELTREMISHYHSGKKEYTLEATGEKLNEFIQVLINSEPAISNYIGKNPPEKVYYHFATFNGGALLTVSYQPTTEDVKSLQRRAASVFEMAYRRYLDLKKAEAQTREAQIEIAVERVRAKALAMHKSEEILSVVVVLRNELLALNIPGVSGTTIYLKQDDGRIRMWDLTSVIELEDGFHLSMDVVFPLQETHPELFIRKIWNATEKYSVQIQNRHDLMRTIAWLGEYKKEEAENVKRFIETSDLQSLYHATVPLVNGKLSIDLMEPPPAEMESILQKMATAFDLAYKRFLDLQKAEAQTREAQIETALERVRSRTMGMQRSGELPEAANLLFQQIQSLGVPVFSTGYNIWEDDKKSVTSWMSSEGIIQRPFKLPLTEETALHDCYNAAQQGDTFFVQELSGEKLLSHFKYMSTLPVIGELMKKMGETGISLPGYMINHHAFFSHGYLLFITYEQVPGAHDIFKRFAKVFEQTYTRFLDLQKAEAQAREAQIEAALERVRAKVMAMTNSKDLNQTSLVFGEQLKKLGIDWQFSYFWLIEETKNENTFWITWPDNKTSLTTYTLAEAEEYFNDCLISWRAGVKIHDNYVPPERVKEWLDTYQRIADDAGGEAKRVMVPQTFQNGVYYYDAMMKYGSFGICISKPATDEEKNIQCRFAIEFERAYTRFLDLKQAEAQARESQIELGLERVRARAMAMQKSDELNELIGTVYTELTKLDLILDRCFIMIYDKSMGVTWWMSNPEVPLKPTGLFVKYHEQAPYQAFLNAWKERARKWQYVLEGEVKKTWDKFLFVETELSHLPEHVIANMKANEKVYLSASFNNFGNLTLATLEPLSGEHFDIMLRFAKVFDLTYTRFNDLKQAEAQTRAAKIEAALERVRARALAMQEPEELKDVASVLRTEMGLLGVEELETCSIYINDVSAENAECWYALKDVRSEEKKLVNDHFALNLNDTWVGREMLQFYQSPEKQISIVMQGANRKEWIRYCEERSAPFRGYYGEVIPDRTYHLYKFSHGAIGAAAAGDISEESWRMLSRAASVFSLAYSRFKDLTQARRDLIQLKEEKKRAEDALTELQVTQKQLIQTEKMASLGELTAGIAHEIQNPLNFVNNFSDVSNELLEEMKTELATGNTQQAIEIINNVKDNLEKILHHGKRADAIVKSMLQHSRSSTGKKEPTDINNLTEEYFRLAFHGLRAKDKSFNAKYETDLDKSIGKVNVISQDVGRVILNLINNAFYAVNEKKKHSSARSASNGYDPVVTVSTKRLNDKIEIKVKDNGDGIPQKVLDKIFQPFFTTKPTGQGTGLGLSLSYDIITKGHGGELFVKTKEGEGTEFIISLPVT